MSVIFSKSCEYAIQAMLYLAKESDHRRVLLRDISQALGIPHHFLSKVLQSLSHHGFVISQRGSHGGFILGHPAREIALIDLVRAVDGEALLERCVLGFAACRDDFPCPLHASWKNARAEITEMLQWKTLEELGNELHPKLELIAELEE